MSLSSNFPTSKPSLNLDFANVGALDPRITFTRSSSATYTNSLGLIATAATNVARFDYDPVTLAPLGLLIEEQRTNLLTYSQALATWATTNGTFTNNSAAAPDGTVTATRCVATDADPYVYQSQTLVAQQYTLSVWIKGEGSAVGKSGTLRGGLNVSSLQTITANWQRYSFTFTASATSQNVGFEFPEGASIGDTVYLWGAQLEAGSFATSYIPTVASTVTRSADVASVNTLSPWFNSSESTLFAEFDFIGAALTGGGIAQLTNNISNNGLLLYQNAVSLNVSAYVDASYVLIGSNSVNVPAKVALAYNGSSNGAVRNGGAVSSVGTTVSAAATQFSLGSFYGGVYQFNGHLRRVASYPRRLTNAELQALTA